MNPNDIFWLARYAHNAVSPLVREGERLQIILDMSGKWPGVQVWIFPARGEISAYKSHITNKGQVDDFVATLQASIDAEQAALEAKWAAAEAAYWQERRDDIAQAHARRNVA